MINKILDQTREYINGRLQLEQISVSEFLREKLLRIKQRYLTINNKQKFEDYLQYEYFKDKTMFPTVDVVIKEIETLVSTLS